MTKRYFWRRAFAYIFDLLICGFFVTIVAVALNDVFSSSILAPALIKSNSCEVRDDLFTAERMNELQPLELGQSHQQILCKQTNMLTTSFYITALQKVWTEGDTTFRITLEYYSDDRGNQRTYISSEPVVYLLAPFLFALFLSRRGQTPGKRMLGLNVSNNTSGTPDPKSALKRECLKGSILFIFALQQLYIMITANNLDIDEAAKLAQSLSIELEPPGIWNIISLNLAIGVAGLWLLFGSFIFWKGQTYWDRFANLNTKLKKETDQSQGHEI